MHTADSTLLLLLLCVVYYSCLLDRSLPIGRKEVERDSLLLQYRTNTPPPPIKFLGALVYRADRGHAL